MREKMLCVSVDCASPKAMELSVYVQTAYFFPVAFVNTDLN